MAGKMITANLLRFLTKLHIPGEQSFAAPSRKKPNLEIGSLKRIK
jgi:hypothetical protein